MTNSGPVLCLGVPWVSQKDFDDWLSDTMLHGKGFCGQRDDGARFRIDPMNVLILPQPPEVTP